MRPEPDRVPPAEVEDTVEQGGGRLDDLAWLRRRRIGAAVLALGGLVLVGVLLAGPVSRIIHPAPTPAPNRDAGVAVGQVAFADARYGYALVRPCPADQECRGTWSLLRTTDAGRGWHRVDSPLTLHPAEQAQVFARGHRAVGLVLDGSRFVSADAGRTWQEVPPVRAAAPVSTVPAGAEVGYLCPSLQPDCPVRLSAFDPVTGVSRPLVHQPPLPPNPAEQVVFATATAGRVWVVASRPDGGPARLLTSPDGGVHWRHVALPERGDWFEPRVLTAPGTDQVYLTTLDRPHSHVAAVWRLADPSTGPARWVPAATVGVPMARIRDVRVLPDGELRYADVAGNAWLTTDRARAVGPAPRPRMDGRPITVNVAQVTGGVVVATPVVGLRGDRVLFSADGGLHWQVRPVNPG